MLQIIVDVQDEGEPADKAARSLAQALQAADGVVSAEPLQRPGPDDAKGLVDVLGVIAVTLMSEGAVAALIDLVKQRLLARKSRRIRLKAGDVELEFAADDMTDAEFEAAAQRLFALLDPKKPA